MQITLEAIKFNHDPTFRTTGAFCIRRNESTPIILPEWEQQRPQSNAHSAVAYAISRLPKVVTIKVRFKITNGWNERLQIRARRAKDGESDPPPANVLGDVKERVFNVQQDQSKWHTFRLENESICQLGVSASNQIWNWEFSTDSQTWQTFQVTKHRVYVVLGLPTKPWRPKSRDSLNVQVPWTEALEWSCHWAAGVTRGDSLVKNLDLIASTLTRRVYALGKVSVTYASDSSFVDSKFDLTRFLSLLNGEPTHSHTVNCDDCATIVSTFANLLGCDLWQSSMGLKFDTNPILQVGESQWASTTFLHHSAAWKGDCLEKDELFDAFLQVDGDRQPNKPPQFPLQPVKLRFGSGREQNYRFRLADSGHCDPIPNDGLYKRRRRDFGSVFRGMEIISDKRALLPAKQIYGFDSWPSSRDSRLEVKETGTALRNLVIEIFAQMGWGVHIADEFHDKRFQNVFQVVFAGASISSAELIGLTVYEPSNPKRSNELLLQLLAGFQFLDLTRLQQPSLGDISFIQAGSVSLLFRLGRIVIVLRSAGLQRASVFEPASTLEKFLCSTERAEVAKYVEFNLKGETKMPLHKFAQNWSWYTVDYSSPDPIARGHMDLTGMLANGSITQGPCSDPLGAPLFKVDGRAYSDSGSRPRSLKLTNSDGERFEGLLVRDTGTGMTISGRRIIPSHTKAKKGRKTTKFDGQTEEPWVITKP